MYSHDVRIIARSTLNAFVQNRVEPSLRKSVKLRLDAWYEEASEADWNSSADVKEKYASASIVTAERVVFNIKGNDFRLVTAIDYQTGVLLIIWVGTHREYDRINVERVEYDRKRYTDLPSSH